MDGLAIRQFTETDRENLMPLMKEFERYLESVDTTQTIHYDDRSTRYSIDRMIKDAQTHDGIVLIAELNGHVIGFLEAHEYIQEEEEALEQGRHKQIELEELFVSSDFRGKGVGHELMGALYTFAKEKGHQRMRLKVHAGNTSAHSTYLKQGFKDFRIEMVKDL